MHVSIYYVYRKFRKYRVYRKFRKRKGKSKVLEEEDRFPVKLTFEKSLGIFYIVEF